VTTDTARRLARALGVSIDYLVSTWDDSSEPDDDDDPARACALQGSAME
jgi:hypothetical protein